jgi:hypothetical protein
MRRAGKAATRPRTHYSDLAEGLEKRTSVYAMAAGAAGVSVLALATPARAEIVYTPANIRVPLEHGDGMGVKIDFNHDGINDFSLWDWKVMTSSYAVFRALYLWADNKTNRAEGARQEYAARLESGATIGPSQEFALATGNLALKSIT